MAKFQAQWHTPIAIQKHRERIWEKLENCEVVSVTTFKKKWQVAKIIFRIKTLISRKNTTILTIRKRTKAKHNMTCFSRIQKFFRCGTKGKTAKTGDTFLISTRIFFSRWVFAFNSSSKRRLLCGGEQWTLTNENVRFLLFL